jgi:hypothetical protein
MSDDARRTWVCGFLSAARYETARAMLDAAGYAPSSEATRGAYTVWTDVEPRYGDTTTSVYVVEDPTKPIVAALEAEFRRG